MALTDVQVRKAKPGEKAFKLFDERGMYLLVTPAGGKLWRLKYRVAGKEKLLALGAYPEVSLSDARDGRDAARKKIAAGGDPSVDRKIEKTAQETTFEAVGRRWYQQQLAKWSPKHAETVLGRIEKNLFPHIGSRPIAEITSREVVTLLERIEARKAFETARRVRQFASDIFLFAIAQGIADNNPAAGLQKVLKARGEVNHRAAITDPKKVAGLLCVLDGYEGTFVVASALRLAPLVFVRPGELRKAEWSEIDLKASQWSIPASRMKMRQPLLVPLSRQAVAILKELQRVTGDGRYLFPSSRSDDRPMSDNAVLAALRRCGIPKDEMSGHGFRAMARTILDEVLSVRVDLIEHQLGHAVKDPNGRAYNRTSFLPERVAMMQKWADYLDGLKATSTPEGSTDGKTKS